MGGHEPVTAPRRHRRSVVLLVGGSLVVALVGIVVVVVTLWFTRESPGARSLDDALAEFRAGDPTAVESIGVFVQRPPSGVYTAAGNGRASIDFPPTSQSYGATVPVIVRADADGCWTTEVDFNDAFRQTWHHCVIDGDVVERSSRTSTRWDLGVMTIDEHADFVCDPPGVIIRAGERRAEVSRYSCVGTSDAIDGSTTSDVSYSMVGAESVDVGGTMVPAFHYVEVDTLTGAQRGTTTIEYWYAIESFLLVRMERDIALRTDSPVGSVTFTENGSWQLQSLDPRR